jgi:hypothetical protein
MQDVQESKPQVSIDEFRHAIDAALEAGELAPVETPLTHYHTDELYGRRIVVPSGSVFTTMVHKTDHIAIALRGHITIVDQDGHKFDVRAPDVFITKAGTQRVIVVHEECEWVTVHHCTEQDNSKVKDVLGYETMKEYEAQKLLEATA